MAHALEGKVVIITGASSGIGAATARGWLSPRARATASPLSPPNWAPIERWRCPPTSRLAGTSPPWWTRQSGALATSMPSSPMPASTSPAAVSEGDSEVWVRLIDVNVNGVLRAVYAVLPRLLAQDAGDILVNSSVSGHQAIHWEPVYSASKHAVQAFVHGLRRQVAARGVRVGAIAPGKVLNELWGITDPTEIDRLVDAHEGLRSEDVADLVVHMLSLPPHMTIRDLVVLPQAQDLCAISLCDRSRRPGPPGGSSPGLKAG
jgi:ribitol 2-dehydrogenase